MATAPLVPQGTLNRVRVSIVVPSFPNLNITAPYMSKQFATISFQGSFAELIPTATGGVASPEPYMMASITCGLIRPQGLASAWLSQGGTQSSIGQVTIYSDTSAWAPITLQNTVIANIEPGAYDGVDPVVRLMLNGIYQINSDLWNLV